MSPPDFFILDMVAGHQTTKCGLKYVIFSQAKKRKKLFAPSDCSELSNGHYRLVILPTLPADAAAPIA